MRLCTHLPGPRWAQSHGPTRACHPRIRSKPATWSSSLPFSPPPSPRGPATGWAESPHPDLWPLLGGWGTHPAHTTHSRKFSLAAGAPSAQAQGPRKSTQSDQELPLSCSLAPAAQARGWGATGLLPGQIPPHRPQPGEGPAEAPLPPPPTGCVTCGACRHEETEVLRTFPRERLSLCDF